MLENTENIGTYKVEIKNFVNFLFQLEMELSKRYREIFKELKRENGMANYRQKPGE